MIEEKNVEGFLCGLSFGDGTLFKCERGRNYTFQVRHCLAQKEYLEWKRDNVSKIILKNINIHDLINWKGHPASQFAITNSKFNFIYPILYPNGVKTITKEFLYKLQDIGVAIWYMDDGSISKKKNKYGALSYEITISTCCSYEEAKICVDFMMEKYGAKFTVRKMKDRYSIRAGVRAARKLFEKIEPFIIPQCMKYKLIPKEHKYRIQQNPFVFR